MGNSAEFAALGRSLSRPPAATVCRDAGQRRGVAAGRGLPLYSLQVSSQMVTRMQRTPSVPSRSQAEPTLAEVAKILRQAGLRPTRQRVALAHLLFAGGDRHVTADMLHEEA